jgi:AraC-like DNA-binding protein
MEETAQKTVPAKAKTKRKYKTTRSAKDLTEAQQRIILEKLNLSDWNVTKTAAEMGMTRRQLDYIIRKHGLKAYCNSGEMARIAKDIVIRHMEDFLDAADSARTEAIERVRELIPRITNIRDLMLIVMELTRYIDGENPETASDGKAQAGSLLKELQKTYNTQINFNLDGKKKDNAIGN